MKSIRGTLTAWLLGALAVILLAGGFGLFAATRRSLTRHFDETLLARASALIAATRWDGAKVDVDFAYQVMPWYGPEARSECFELRAVGEDGAPVGEPIMRSPSLRSRRWDLPEVPAEGRTIMDAPLPDGRRGRIVAVGFRPVPDEEVEAKRTEEERRAIAATAPRLVLVAGKSRMELDRAVATLLTSLAGAGVVVALGVIAAVRVAVHRGLAPLDRLSADVRGIGADSLSRRLDEASLPVELRSICGRLNDLLERLESAFARERRFTAAAAHELRTPVAELRSMLEVGLSRPRTAEESRRSLDDALAVALQMERMIQTLFMMAGHESGHTPHLAPVEVSPLLARMRERHGPAARARGGEIVVGAPAGVRVVANDALLEAVLDNIVANAVEYSAPSPSVRCDVLGAENGGSVRIDITNPAAGLSDGEAQRFFEPFWRRNDSRSEHGHLGLGLPLARQFAEAMGGTLTADLEPPANLRVRLSLRATHAADGPALDIGVGAASNGG